RAKLLAEAGMFRHPRNIEAVILDRCLVVGVDPGEARAGSPTRKLMRLQQRYLRPRLRQAERGRTTNNAAADHNHLNHDVPPKALSDHTLSCMIQNLPESMVL